MMVALIGVLKEFRNLPLTDYELAELAHSIERDELGIKGGRQDQYAATFGGFNFIELYGDRVVVNPLRVAPDVMLELEHNLLLCYTGTTRQSDHIIEDQTARFEAQRRGRGRGPAGAEGARGGDEERAAAAPAARLRRAAGHRLGGEEADVDRGSRTTASTSSTTTARAAGALGGKVTGAGGGGYMLLYCRYDRKHQVARRG